MLPKNTTALANGVHFLYHYQKFNQAHLTSPLRDQKIYCSDTSSMNDPWDFKPAFDSTPMQIDPGNLRRMIEMFRAAADPATLNSPLRLELEDNIRGSDDELQRFVEKASNGLWRELRKRRIYCLTPLSNSILMWSHYARNHTGICLEFNVDNPLFSVALKVNYRDTYPPFTPQDASFDPTSLILTKAVDWAYEGEYRIIGLPNYPGVPLHLDGAFLHLPPDALNAVIIGCEAQRDPIEKLIRKLAPTLPIKHARRISNKYKLEII